MIPLFRGFAKEAESGEALPDVWPTLANAGIRFYRSDVSLVVGPPGQGKSILALQTALTSRVPTLYISCDMGRFLTSCRAAAVLTETPIEQVKSEMQTAAGRQRYSSVVGGAIDHLYMAYESRPNADDVLEMAEAFQEVWGIPPARIIVDNLMNLYSGSENEWTGLRDLSQVFHFLATDKTSHVMILHHAKLGGYDLSSPAPLWAVKGQITELPALILTVAKRPGEFRVAAVKNRHGNSDPSGHLFYTLDFDEPRGILREYASRLHDTGWRELVSGNA